MATEKPRTSEVRGVWASVGGATGWIYVRELATGIGVSIGHIDRTLTADQADSLARSLRAAARRTRARAG